MSKDAKLILEAPLHVGCAFDLTDPVLKDYGHRILEKNNALNGQRRIIEAMEADIEGVKEIFWARVLEVLPATQGWDMRLSGNCTQVIVAGPGRRMAAFPLEAMQALKDAFNNND